MEMRAISYIRSPFQSEEILTSLFLFSFFNLRIKDSYWEEEERMLMSFYSFIPKQKKTKNIFILLYSILIKSFKG